MRILFFLIAVITSVQAVAQTSKINLNIKTKVLILGNSITQHPPAPNIGWNGNWGMAASTKDKDFVHLLEKRIKAKNKNSVVMFKNIADYERTFWTYDLNKLKSLKDFKPDLLILKIGENVDSAALLNKNFANYYGTLINYFKNANRHVKIICVTTFWENERLDNVIKKVAQGKGATFVQLNHLSLTPSSTASGKFENAGVAAHPSDKGMQLIANSIWNKLISN